MIHETFHLQHTADFQCYGRSQSQNYRVSKNNQLASFYPVSKCFAIYALIFCSGQISCHADLNTYSLYFEQFIEYACHLLHDLSLIVSHNVETLTRIRYIFCHKSDFQELHFIAPHNFPLHFSQIHFLN